MVYRAHCARIMLALKLKAIRVNDPVQGEQERLDDVLNLMRVVLGIARPMEPAIEILGTRYFRKRRRCREAKVSC